MARLDKPQKLGVEDPGMACSPVTSHLTESYAASSDIIDVPKPAVTTVLPSDGKNAKELDFNDTDVIALFKEKNYKVHLCVLFTSSILRSTVSIFRTGAGPILACMSFLLVKWRNCVRTIHNRSQMSISSSPFPFMDKVSLFV